VTCNAHLSPVGTVLPINKKHTHQAPVAHACNLSYSGGKDQEDHSSKPAQENSPQDPISKNPITEMGWCFGLNRIPQYLISPPITEKKKKKKKKKRNTPILQSGVNNCSS
jgi:hypothetical protein